MHLSMVNPHVRTILDLQASKGGGAPGWHAARQTSGAARTALGAITGVSSFAFQGTNAHAIIQEAHDQAAVASSKLSTWAHQRVWLAPPTNPFLQRLVASGGRGSRRPHATIETALVAPRLAFLREHMIKGIQLVPAAAFLEIATAATGMLLNSTILDTTAIGSAVFATPMLLGGRKESGAVSKLICTVNLASGTVEVASLQHASASGSHHRAHFYAALASIAAPPKEIINCGVSAVTGNQALSLGSLLFAPSQTTQSLSGRTKVGPAALAAVAIPSDSNSFHAHPAATEAAVFICGVHPTAQKAGLRVAAKVESSAFSALGTNGNRDQGVWALGMPGNSGKLNSLRMRRDVGGAHDILAGGMDGIEMRRLVTERPAMHQPK